MADNELKELLKEAEEMFDELGITYVDDGEKLVPATEFYEGVEPDDDDDEPEEDTADYSDYED